MPKAGSCGPTCHRIWALDAGGQTTELLITIALDADDLKLAAGCLGPLPRIRHKPSAAVRAYDLARQRLHAGPERRVLEMPLEDYWREIAYVPQDAFLFSRSIRENIALSAPAGERDDERVVASAFSLCPCTRAVRL